MINWFVAITINEYLADQYTWSEVSSSLGNVQGSGIFPSFVHG